MSFIDPCLPTKAVKPPEGDAWAHEIKHEGIRLQIHAMAGRVRLFTMTGVDWTDRYPRIVKAAERLKRWAIIDAEVVCQGEDGIADFEALQSRIRDHDAVAFGFDLLMHDGVDLRAMPLIERKTRLDKLLRPLTRTKAGDGVRYVEHLELDGSLVFKHVCATGLEGIISKRLDSKYRSGRSKAWLKTRNPNSPAARRIEEGTFA